MNSKSSIKVHVLDEDIEDHHVKYKKQYESSHIYENVNLNFEGGRKKQTSSKKEKGDKAECQLSIFSSIKDLKSTQTKRTNFECNTCNKFFSSKYNLKVHMLRHGDQEDYPFSCKECPMRFVSKLELVKHKGSHNKEKNFTCQKCGKKFQKEIYLATHTKMHHDPSDLALLMCGVCDFSSYSKNALKSHLVIHEEERKVSIKCPLCDAEFLHKNSLRSHLLYHGNVKNFECDKCDKKFICNRYLVSHKQIVHGPKTNLCPHCDKKFATPSNLKRHILTHTGEKPYPCCFCSYSCNAQGNIVKHIRLTHNNQSFTFKDYQLKMGLSTPHAPLDPKEKKNIRSISCDYAEKFLSQVAARNSSKTVNKLIEKVQQIKNDLDNNEEIEDENLEDAVESHETVEVENNITGLIDFDLDDQKSEKDCSTKEPSMSFVISNVIEPLELENNGDINQIAYDRVNESSLVEFRNLNNINSDELKESGSGLEKLQDNDMKEDPESLFVLPGIADCDVSVKYGLNFDDELSHLDILIKDESCQSQIGNKSDNLVIIPEPFQFLRAERNTLNSNLFPDVNVPAIPLGKICHINDLNKSFSNNQINQDTKTMTNLKIFDSKIIKIESINVDTLNQQNSLFDKNNFSSEVYNSQKDSTTDGINHLDYSESTNLNLNGDKFLSSNDEENGLDEKYFNSPNDMFI